jgi:hypothetical protein
MSITKLNTVEKDMHEANDNEQLFSIYDLEHKKYDLYYKLGDKGQYIQLQYNPSELIDEFISKGYDDKLFIFLYIYFDETIKSFKNYHILKQRIPDIINNILDAFNKSADEAAQDIFNALFAIN